MVEEKKRVQGGPGALVRAAGGGASTLVAASAAATATATKNPSKTVPLTADETFNFSLFGDYSEKFSFSVGCGLPGRV